jgi:hypothetical protein
MKKMLSNFEFNSISRNELKKIMGGGGECSSCGQSQCSGGCGEKGTCEWQKAMPSLGLGAGCTCNHTSGGIQ